MHTLQELSTICCAGAGLALSEEAVWYGLRMTDKTGGSLRSQVKPENKYERKLLAEVLDPQEVCAFTTAILFGPSVV